MKLYISLLFLFAINIAAQDTLRFIIRVDDVLSRNATYLPRTINHFQTAVENRGGKITWAIIPARLIESQNSDGELKRDLKNSLARGHEGAVHGYDHICNNCGESGHEMFCVKNSLHFSYTQQKQLIQSSQKLLLDSINLVPRSFVPPGHYNDSTTWQVLLDQGFDVISTNGPMKGYVYKSLFNIMRHAEYSWALTSGTYQANLKKALADIRTAAVADGYFCLLFHDPFIRKGYENGLVITWTAELLDSVNKQFAGKVKYTTLHDAAEYFKGQVTSVVSRQEAEMPDSPRLSQNYPNPFNGSTTISYYMPASGDATIVVYNGLGQQVRLNRSRHDQSGQYQLRIDFGDLPSGIYYYRLEALGTGHTKKMLYLK